MPRYLLLDEPESKEIGDLTQGTPAELSPNDFAIVQVDGEARKVTIQDLVDAVSSGNSDAFGRLRVSNPVTLFDSKQVYDNQPLVWSERTTGAGTTSTHNANKASVTIAADPSVVGSRIRQTRQRFNYQPGKSQLVYMTTRLGGIQANVVKRLGLLDDNNGLFCQVDSNGIGFGIRTFTSGAAVNSVTYDGAWSELNSGDGILPIMDPNDTQIIAIDFEWLGVGRVRFGFVIDGQLYWVHEVNTANIGQLVYMSTPVLPLRYSVTSDGGGAPGSSQLDHICTTVMSEGGQQFTGIERSVSRTTSLTATTAGTIYPILGLRINAANPNSVFDLTSFTMVTDTASCIFEIAVFLNPTLAGPAPVWTPVTNSIIEASTTVAPATTITAATGTKVTSNLGITGGGTTANSTVRITYLNKIPVGFNASGVADQLWVAAIPRVGSPIMWASSSWFEVS